MTNLHARQIRTAALGAVAALALTAGVAAPALAASGGVTGSYFIADHGQGCWGGGTLNSDGSLGGSGGCALSTPAGVEVASIVPESWAFVDATRTAVTLCIDVVVKKGPPVISGQACVPVPVTRGAPVNIPQLGPDTFGKVTLTG
jgi:hypothetical protein